MLVKGVESVFQAPAEGEEDACMECSSSDTCRLPLKCLPLVFHSFLYKSKQDAAFELKTTPTNFNSLNPSASAPSPASVSAKIALFSLSFEHSPSQTPLRLPELATRDSGITPRSRV
ncbi:hypothetical protein DNTS_013370 [Danionella cerebrum]|uniref:Uncharacterized protein n=1 Tax=Danionella cerebrum TaxID=2873325 RepID=A0A553NWN4_9TELE|nr:hypothetical protein DNTS_013370 [Danionella translucida]